MLAEHLFFPWREVGEGPVVFDTGGFVNGGTGEGLAEGGCGREARDAHWWECKWVG